MVEYGWTVAEFNALTDEQYMLFVSLLIERRRRERQAQESANEDRAPNKSSTAVGFSSMYAMLVQEQGNGAH